jgi:hypothetical protein
MGSMGSLGQTDRSDLDYWVCYRPSRVSGKALELFRRKLEMMSRWALDAHQTEANFYLVDLSLLERGQISRGWGQDVDGDAAPLLLLEELYRTLVLVAGRAPLWMATPAGTTEPEYARLARRAAPLEWEGEPPPMVNMGFPRRPEPQEYLAAAMWLTCKSEAYPFKGMLKIIPILEAVETGFTAPLLCDVVKAEVIRGASSGPMVDPYLITVERVIAYAASRLDPDQTDLIRAASVLKILGLTGKLPAGGPPGPAAAEPSGVPPGPAGASRPASRSDASGPASCSGSGLNAGSSAPSAAPVQDGIPARSGQAPSGPAASPSGPPSDPSVPTTGPPSDLPAPPAGPSVPTTDPAGPPAYPAVPPSEPSAPPAAPLASRADPSGTASGLPASVGRDSEDDPAEDDGPAAKIELRPEFLFPGGPALPPGFARPDPFKTAVLERWSSDWGWRPERLARLLAYDSWSERERLLQGNAILLLLFRVYMQISNSLMTLFPDQVNAQDEELTPFAARIMGRQRGLEATVDLLPSQFHRDGLSKNLAIHRNAPEGSWAVYATASPEASGGQGPRREGDLVYEAERAVKAAAWLVRNGLCGEGFRVTLDPEKGSVDPASFMELLDALGEIFPPVTFRTLDPDRIWLVGAQGPVLLAFNFECPSEASRIVTMDAVFRTGWGEIRHEWLDVGEMPSEADKCLALASLLSGTCGVADAANLVLWGTGPAGALRRAFSNVKAALAASLARAQAMTGAPRSLIDL